MCAGHAAHREIMGGRMPSKYLILLLGAIVWFATIFWLSANGVFVSGPAAPPVRLSIAFLAPILLFLVSVRLQGWRGLVVSIPPVLLIALNGWRFIGLGFLMAYEEGLLPGGFAWPAGLGDIAMAATAPWIAARVTADDRFRFSSAFLVWNLLGIVDFVNAVVLGTLYSWPGFNWSTGTALMQRLPFVLIPCFFVPLVAIAHITLLVQRRQTKTGAEWTQSIASVTTDA
jgi:hypothetical protein